LRGDAVAQGRRRDAILTAAGDEFALCGFAGARIDRIAAAAAVNKQLIFHYFRSKEGLYSAVTFALFATWQPVPDSAVITSSERLRQIVAHLVLWLSENPGAVRAVADAGRRVEGPASPVASQAAAVAWLANVGAVVHSVVEGGQRQGFFRDDVDPAVIADIVISCAVGHPMAAGSRSNLQPAESARLAATLSQAMVEYSAWR
jgi:AcrR family transcriptional regulator